MPAVPADSSHAEFVRRSMRQSWGARRREYLREAAPNTAAHARQLLSIVQPQPGERVLDVATGPGVVALLAAATVAPGGEVVATDLAPEWGEIVAERCGEAGIGNVVFKEMGAESLDLADDSFDVALCQFGLMFVPDPAQALREMRRVLRPDGRLGVVVWSTADKARCISLTDHVLASILPQVPADQQLPTPLALGEPGLIERHVADAGFRDVAVARHTLDFVTSNPEGGWQFRVVEGPPAVREALARLDAAERARLHDAFIAEYERYRQGDAIRIPSEAIYVTARR